MSNPNTYKALIFTTLLSSVVVFLGFTIHIKKKSELVAETFYELEAESIEDVEQEELEDILKSLDNLLSTPETNQAYNETNDYENQELDDKAFEKQMDAIKNRTSIEDIKAVQENSTLTASRSNSDDDNSSAFNNINDIVNKRSENQKEIPSIVNKNSSISYSLVDRTHTFLPTPVYLCEYGGKVIINITVDYDGNVTDAHYNNASTSNNGCLIDHALEYAKAAKFNRDATKASQIGSITFYFKGKQ